LFRQANEHRIFTYSLAVLTDYSLFGSLNFKRLGWEANLTMILLLYFVNLLNTADRKNPWLILPVALLFFVPQHEITNWPIVGFGSTLQYSLVVASLWFLARPGWISITGALLLASMATFSFGNGMLTFPVGFLVLALKKPKQPVVWFIWAIAMATTIFLYFQDYTFRGQSGLLSSAILNPGPVIQYILTFFGTILARYPNVTLLRITIAGIIPLSALACLVIFKWEEVKKHPVALSVMLFVILSAAMAAVSRQAIGIGGATAPRYVLLQALFLAVLYLLFINIYAKKYKWLPLVFLSLAFMIYGGRMVKGIYKHEQHKEHLHELIRAYHLEPSRKVIFGPEPPIIKKILDKSSRTGIYTPPEILWLAPRKHIEPGAKIEKIIKTDSSQTQIKK
jgi:hypothetical protein